MPKIIQTFIQEQFIYFVRGKIIKEKHSSTLRIKQINQLSWICTKLK